MYNLASVHDSVQGVQAEEYTVVYTIHLEKIIFDNLELIGKQNKLLL